MLWSNDDICASLVFLYEGKERSGGRAGNMKGKDSTDPTCLVSETITRPRAKSICCEANSTCNKSMQ